MNDLITTIATIALVTASCGLVAGVTIAYVFNLITTKSKRK